MTEDKAKTAVELDDLQSRLDNVGHRNSSPICFEARDVLATLRADNAKKDAALREAQSILADLQPYIDFEECPLLLNGRMVAAITASQETPASPSPERSVWEKENDVYDSGDMPIQEGQP